MCRAAIRPIRFNLAYSRRSSFRFNRRLPTYLALVFATLLTGCAGKPVIQTQVIEKPVAVPCLVDSPPECKSAYAVDRVSIKDDPLTINRALRAEIEERSACEVKLLAALRGCKKGMRSM
jgi:hypothetical protein